MKFGFFILLLLLLLSASVVGVASGEEGTGAPGAFAEETTDQSTPSFLPSDIDSAADLAPLISDSNSVDFEPHPDPAVAKELPHTDLDRAEAEKLLKGVFGADEFESLAEFFDELDFEAFRSNHVAVVAPTEPGAEPGLLFSTLPLRTVDESGAVSPVDLNLEASGSSIEPANSPVQVAMPTQLSEGISLPDAGVTVKLAGGEVNRGASELGDASAFYPNVAADTDLIVAPVPTGFETFTHIRSSESPTEQRFILDVPADADVQRTDQGGVEVASEGGSTILSISPPSAIDANGSPVPAKIEVDGTSVILSVEAETDAAYPILVDPVWDAYNFTSSTSPGVPGKDWFGSYTGKQFGYSWGTPNYGMNTRALVGPTLSGSTAWFNYYVPRYWSDLQAGLPSPTTYIRQMNMWSAMFYMPDELNTPIAYRPAYPSFQAGLWSELYNKFAAYGERFGYEGQPLASQVYELNNYPNDDTNVKNGGFGIATMSSYNTVNRYVNVQQASVELTDQESPEWTFGGDTSGWMNVTATAKIPYVVVDQGLGIYSFKVQQPKTGGGAEVITTSNSCVGSSQSPCPRQAETATRAIGYNPQTMAQGENLALVTASDPVGHVSNVKEVRVKVDHTAPAILLSGNLTQQGTVGTNLREYTLNYTAKDGDDATASALMAWGAAGKAEKQLERPMGVAVASDGSIYAVDRLNNRVIKYDTEGKPVLQFGSTGSGDGQFNDPRGIDIAPDGTVWVADMGNDRIQAFSPTGTFLRKANFTESASEPYAITTGPGGILWVTDIGLHRLVKVSESSMATLLTTTGRTGPPYKGTAVISPTGVATDKFGNVWIADGGLGKVLELDSAGNPLFQFGTAGSGNGQIDGIVGIDVSPAGNIAITERTNGRVQIFKPDGSYLRKFGSTGSGNDQFFEAGGLSFGPDNMLAVADAGNKRIARWSHADQDPQSGVTEVEVEVDGKSQHSKWQNCATKNCSITGSWTLDADDFAGGAHKLEVIATDAVGISQTKTIEIQTHGDHTDPTIALSGTMTEQASLGTTRPSYKLKAAATDPGPTEELKSGVASTTIKVDGTLVDSSSPGCPAGGCTITREWTLNSDSYSVGSHTVEVKATDAAGRISTKTLTINIARDTTPPEVSFWGAFYSAPSGWLEQKAVGYAAYATDFGGYGVTSVELKIDGAVVDAATQSCAAGACTKLFGSGKTLDMSAYSGGAHPAEFIAKDGAGNIHKRTWTINVDPEGHISASEAEDTLEALDETSAANTVGSSSSETAYEGTAEGLELKAEGNVLVAQGSAAPTTLTADIPGDIHIEVPTPSSEVACPIRSVEESEEPRTGKEEEELAQTVGCEEPPAIPSEAHLLTPVSITPVGNIGSGSQSVTPNSAAAVAQNIAPNVDLVTRPLFDGGQTFTAIRNVSAPDSFSWRVRLVEDQTLSLVNSKLAAVAYPDGHVGFTITAVLAHDAVGTTVPTSLSVDGDVLTLHVDHKSASFVYPVVGGAGWEGGFHTYEVDMGPITEGLASEEGGEVVAGEIPQEGVYREVTFGPPESAAGAFVPLAAQKENLPVRKRQYNFHDCRFEVNGGVQEPPAGGSGGGNGVVRREAAIKKCHGEEDGGPYGEYFVISWAAAIHGTYFYQPQGWVWINKEPQCKRWGPQQPALRSCLPGPNGLDGVYKPKLDLLGSYRFAPGNFGPGVTAGSAACYRLNGVLPNRWVSQETGSNVLEVTKHTYVESKNPDDSCTWQDLHKLE